MKRFVTLTGCPSYTIEGPYTRKRYTFQRGVKTEVHPGDWEFFRSLPSRFLMEADDRTDIPKPRRFTPLDHVTVKPREIPLNALRTEKENTLKARAQGRMDWIKSNAERKADTARSRLKVQVKPQTPAPTTTVIRPEDFDAVKVARNSNPALNARNPEDALRLIETTPALSKDMGAKPVTVVVQG